MKRTNKKLIRTLLVPSPALEQYLKQRQEAGVDPFRRMLYDEIGDVHQFMATLDNPLDFPPDIKAILPT